MLYTEWKSEHYNTCDVTGARLGQNFCNHFIKGRWPELFYCDNDFKSEAMIVEWLTANQYWPFVPDYRNSWLLTDS